MKKRLIEEFVNPPDEFSPLPFWFWNGPLSEGEIRRQIYDFKEKGVMGFVIHPRIGIPENIPYLSDRFMELVKGAVREAAGLGMKVVLYDEGMYPSGSAHGMVVKDNPEYASKGLKMAEYPCMGKTEIVPELGKGEKVVSILAVQKTGEKSIKINSTLKINSTGQPIVFDPPHEGNWSVLVFTEIFSKGTIRGIHFGEDDGETKAPPSSDLLNIHAIEKFIQITHERYYAELKEFFGDTIIAMFTDEPGILGRNAVKDLVPWTEGFLDWYVSMGNSELDLPVLWMEAGLGTQEIRRNYRKAVNAKLEESYYKPISEWCEQHGIAFAGHPERSDDIGFLKHFHIPGQDIVWRWVSPEDGKAVAGEHSTMGKCSSDAARHAGRRRNSNECFGCCGPNGIQWAFSMDDMKWYLDWLFVRGVNLVYPHAFYYSIEGSKRYGERPPDVGPNNIWWKYYRIISDYIKRMCWLITDSTNQTHIAVLCEEDHLPWAIVKALYQNQLEFNYLEENILLSDSSRMEDGFVTIAGQKYSTVVIENISILSAQLMDYLQKFINSGGCVLIHNSDNVDIGLTGVRQVNDFTGIIDVLNENIERDIVLNPHYDELRVSHVVKGGKHFYLLVNEGETLIDGHLSIRTCGRLEKWDPWKGTAEELSAAMPKHGTMHLPVTINRRESVILYVDPDGNLMEHTDLGRKASSKTLEICPEWKVSNPEAGLCILTVKDLETWTNWLGMEDYTGTLAYEAGFEVDLSAKVLNVKIDLGEVFEIAHVYVNGSDAGVMMWSPYIFDITMWVRQGNNSIRIEVANSLANRFNSAKLKSGLIGPVQLILEYGKVDSIEEGGC